MIVQCSHCGAPIEVKLGDGFAKCAYCSRTERVRGLETLHAQTPAGWAPPPSWTPPPGMRVQITTSMPYHPPVGERRRRPNRVGCFIALTFLPGLIGGAIALAGSGVFSGWSGLDADAPPTLGVVAIGSAPTHAALHGTTHGTFERSSGFSEFDSPPTIVLNVARRCIVALRTHSTDDTTLVLHPASGAEHYDDDGGEGLDSALSVALEPGRYPVWVGHRNEGVAFDLSVDAFPVNAPPSADGLAFAGPALLADVTLGPSTEPMHWNADIAPTVDTSYCFSHLTALPQLLVHTTTPRVVMLGAHSDVDPTLVVRDPSGRVTCDDDSGDGNDARIVTTLQPGTTAIWLGALHDRMNGMTGAMLVLEPHAAGEQPLAPMIMPEAPASGRTVELDAITGRHPDDVVVAGRVHGYLDASTLGNGCVGRVQSSPTVSLRTRSPRHVVVRGTGSDDMVLASRGPNGEVRCNDDSSGRDPRLDLQLSPGETDVWIGPLSESDETFELRVVLRP